MAECAEVCGAMKKQPECLEALVLVAPEICSTSIFQSTNGLSASVITDITDMCSYVLTVTCEATFIHFKI